jgi:PEGA domain
MRRIPRLVALALTGGLALTALSLPAAAQPAASSATPTKAQQQQEAATRFKKGLEAYKDADYQAALIEFRRANELAPNFNVLYNIGQVYYLLQDYPGALGAFERYLAEGGSSIPSSRRGDVLKDIEKLKARVANIEIVTTVPDAEITIDDVVVGKSPLSRAIMVSAGRHRVSVSKAGFTTSIRIVEVASGDQPRVPIDPVEIKAALPPPPSDQPRPPEQSPTPPVAATPPPPVPPASRAVPVAGIVVTGGLTVGAVITGVLALGAQSDLATQRTSPAATRDSLDSAQSKTKGLALATDILAGGAIVSLGATLIVGLSGKKEASPQSGFLTLLTGARVGVGPTGARLLGSF